MFKMVQDAFRIKEIRHRIFYVLLALVIIRMGSQIPVPGVNSSFFATYFQNTSNDAFNFLNAFTGGGFSNFSILALSITPYITASIIVQLLTIAIPKLEEMAKEGPDGRKKLEKVTRFLTIALSLIESISMCIGFGNQGLITEMNVMNVIAVVATLTAGSAFLMWIGEQITDKGVGNGISMVLLINILSRIPSDLMTLHQNFASGPNIAKNVVAWVVIIAIIIFVTVLVLILNGATRKIPVQYSKKMAGRRMVGGNSSHIPLKVNTAGVIPIIFAASIMSFPNIIVAFTGKTVTGFWGHVLNMLSSSHWFQPSNWLYTIGVAIYVFLVIFFAYFYTSITFNPMEVSDNLRKQGGFIPGIRPGKPTTDYLNEVLKYIIFIGAAGLCIVAIIPFVFNGLFNASVSFGGTSLIIIGSVTLDTLKQIESMMVVRNYRGFLND